MKRFLQTFASIAVTLVTLLQVVPADAKQAPQDALTNQDSMQTKCVARVNDFLKWYTPFAIADDYARHSIKSSLVKGKKVWEIDTIGTIAEVDRYYKSGFFTVSWRQKAISNILAADSLLTGAIADTQSDFYNDGDLTDVKGITTDPALGLNAGDALGDGHYSWKISGFRRLRHGRFQIDLSLHWGIPGADTWILYLVLKQNKLEIERVSPITSLPK